MNEVNINPATQDMTWSYSRIKSFDDCPYRFYLKYICRLEGEDLFFSSYGRFMHKLIAQFLSGEATKEQIINTYLTQFKTEVPQEAPSITVFAHYLNDGLNYLQDIIPMPYNTLSVEKRVDFSVGGYPFVGYIDVLGEKDGELYIVDHKSRTLKPRSKRAKPTKTDLELDQYFTQLYLYAHAVSQEIGKHPDKLCFNCFRNQEFIKEQFSEDAYTEAQAWAVSKIEEIETTEKFKPDIQYFKCKHICDMHQHCEYYELI